MKKNLKLCELRQFKRMIWITILCAVFVVITVRGVVAQGLTVTGNIKNIFGEPVPGVTIIVKGTTNGTVSNSEGRFSIVSISSDAILVFSFVGMKTQEISVSGETIIDVVMEEDAIGLEEVVAIGYGTMKKSDLTGSVASVKSDLIHAFPTTTVSQSLQGRISGVHVIQNTGQPGQSMQIRIRGTNSIKGDNNPLWIIDGFPGNPDIINVADIESLEVLKDASATAIYGSRGANGVILVTTKHGKQGATRVEYNGSMSMQSVIKKLPLMDAKEYMQLTNIQQLNDVGSEYFTKSQINSAGEGTDWQDLMFKTAPVNEHSLSVSGGNDKTQFSVGTSYYKQDGILMENSSFQRISLRANVNHDISRIFSISYNVILNRTDNGKKGDDWTEYGIYGMFSQILTAPPTLKPYDEDGSYVLLKTAYPFLFDGQGNPVMWAKEITNKYIANNVMANLAFTFKPIEGLSIKITGNASNSDTRTDYYKPTSFIGSSGDASINTGQGLNLNSDNIVTYNKKINDVHNITATGAVTYEQSTSTSLGASGSGFISDIYETYNIGAASTIKTPSSSYVKWTLLSYLGRLNYSYKNKYLATISFRADGSSRYSAGNKWGYFPSGALAWRISDEGFMENIKAISNLKLRIGYGETGSTAISPYSTISMLSTGKAVLNKTSYTYFAPGSTYPGDLKWETTAQTDIGLDIGLFENRLNFTLDYYNKKTRDLLNDVQMPVSSGYTRTIKNIGEIQNKGFELQIDANVLDQQLKWNISANVSLNRNKVLKLYEGQDIMGASLGNTGNVNIVREGESIALFYGYKEDGYTENGVVKYKDIVKDDVINDADKTIIGDPAPDFIYSMNSVMSYKNFEFSFYIQGSHGNDIYSQSEYFLNHYYGYGINMFKDVLYDHWTESTPDAKYPKIMKSNFTSQKLSDRFVYDGSYVRLKNIQLAYNIPVRNFGIKWIKRGQIFVSAQNLLTITSYPWYDPDVNNFGGGASLNQGIDAFSYPTTKGITFGVKLGF